MEAWLVDIKNDEIINCSEPTLQQKGPMNIRILKWDNITDKNVCNCVQRTFETSCVILATSLLKKASTSIESSCETEAKQDMLDLGLNTTAQFDKVAEKVH